MTEKKGHSSKRKKVSSSERAMNLRFRFVLTVFLIAAAVIVYFIVKLNSETQTMIRQNDRSAETEAVSGTSAISETASSSLSAAVTSGKKASAKKAEEAKIPAEKAALINALPDIDLDSWEYILVNRWNMLDETYIPETREIENVEISTEIYDALTQFVEDARAQGLSVCISSGYRSYEIQEQLMENDVEEYGEEEALKTLSLPGASEHQTGLATDLTDVYYEYKDESIEDTDTYKWLLAHCQEYGFILRYPKGKENITGIDYEPWHFRYVGKEAAEFIQKNGLTLEEFLELYTLKEQIQG